MVPQGNSKNILINVKSAHPASVKRAVLRNMFRTAMQTCSGEDERRESRKLATQIACSNGYHPSPHIRHLKSGEHRAENRLPLCLPFISDKISAAIQKCIIRAQLQDDVMLVNIPNDNIKKSWCEIGSTIVTVYLSNALFVRTGDWETAQRWELCINSSV